MKRTIATYHNTENHATARVAKVLPQLPPPIKSIEYQIVNNNTIASYIGRYCLSIEQTLQ